MRFTTTFILLIVTFTICSAQAPVNGVISINPKYAVSDTLDYYEINMAEDSENPGQAEVIHVSPFQIIVNKQIDTFLFCTWQYGKSEVLGLDTFKIDAYTLGLLQLNDGLSFDFKLDLNGNFVGLSDYATTKAALNKKFDFVINNMPGETDTATIRYMRQQLEKTLSNETTMTSMYFQNIVRLFQFNNLSLHEDSMLLMFTELPSPFGTSGLPAVQECYFDGIEDGILSIVTETYIDDEKIDDFIFDLLSSFEGAEGKFKKEDFEGLDMYEEVLFGYDIINRHIVLVEYTRTINFQDREKIQYRVLMDKKEFDKLTSE
jgi:hypothetical protein